MRNPPAFAFSTLGQRGSDRAGCAASVILGVVWHREKQTVMADVRGNREHLFSSERKKKTARNPKGGGMHNYLMNIDVGERWGRR